MNINVASWWELFAVLSGPEEAVKQSWEKIILANVKRELWAFGAVDQSLK